MGEFGREKPKDEPRLRESLETGKISDDVGPMVVEGGNESLTPEQNRVVEQVVADIKREENGGSLTETLSYANIDTLVARYIEKGTELDPVVKHSLQKAVRRAFNLSD